MAANEMIQVSEDETASIMKMMPHGYCASFSFGPGIVRLKYEDCPIALYILGFLRGVIKEDEMNAKIREAMS